MEGKIPWFGCLGGALQLSASTRAPICGETEISVTGEEDGHSSRQLCTTKGGPAYAAIVAGHAVPKKPSGPLKCTCKDFDPAETPTSSEAATRRMSLGLLSGTPPGNTPTNDHMVVKVVPFAVQVEGAKDTRVFLAWLRSPCPKGISAHMKIERLLVVTETAYNAAVSTLRSLHASKSMSSYTFSVPEDRCVRFLFKTLDRRMHESLVREEFKVLEMCVQRFLKLLSGHRNHEPEKCFPVIPHFIVSVVRTPEATNVRPLTQLCGLRVTVETHSALKQRCGQT